MDHIYFNIPGWFGFHDVYDRAVALAPDGAHFVEVGCWKGRSTAYLAVNILNSKKRILLDVVDTFEGSSEHAGIDCSGLFDEFMANLAPVSHAIRHVRRESSLRAAERYPDVSLAFVFLDASHEKADVMADIMAWMPKLRDGGVMAGDDLTWRREPDETPPVAAALQELGYFTEKNPGLVSGGVYPAWIIAPVDQMDRWKTPRESI